MKAKNAAALTGLVSGIGAAVAIYLVRVHVAVKSGLASGGVCDISSTVNCDAAALSSYSELFGVPIAVLGLAGYCAAGILVLWSIPGRSNDSGPLGIASILQSYYGFATAYSVFLGAVSFIVLPAICPACLALYGVNALGLTTATVWARRSPLKTLAFQLAALGEALAKPTTLSFVGLVVVVSAVGVGYPRAAISQASSSPSPSAPKRVDPSALHVDHAPARGSRQAPLQMVVFSDFQCPYCSRFAKTLTFAEETFGEKLRIEFRHYPLPGHQFAPLASAAAICAHRQGRFWDFHDRLFADQSQVNPEGLNALADDLGMDAETVSRCSQDPEVRAQIAADREAGEAAGVRGTPAFFVNGTFYNGALPIEELSRVLELELERSGKLASDEG